jgi:hypothetical protein
MALELKTEQIVVSWLRNHGYFRVERKVQESIFEADGKIRRMLVAVSTVDEIDSDYQERIKTEARKENREPWIAKVDSQEEEIYWSHIL